MKYHLEFDIDFRRNPGSGLYIALEGIDGSGKTTQVERLAEYLESKDKEVVKTREPRSDGLVGKLVREILSKKISVPPVALQYLFTADRSIHHETIVLPALKKGNVVISDRTFWSAIPYGIMDKMMAGESYNFSSGNIILVAQSILSMYHQFVVADYTFYLDVSVATACSRIQGLEKVNEIYEDSEKLEKIHAGYEWLIQKFPDEIIRVDAEKSEEEVTEAVIHYIKE